MKQKQVTATNIIWDADDEDTSSLPTEIDISIPKSIKSYEEAVEFVSDAITNLSGFCHMGFTCSPELSTFKFGKGK